MLNLITHPLTSHWSNKYNRLYRTCLSFIFARHIHTYQMHQQGFLSIKNMYLSQLLNLTYKSLYLPEFPNYLKVKLQAQSRFSLRSDDHIQLETPFDDHKHPFQFTTSNQFNNLPPHIRDIQGIQHFNTFKKMVKTFLLEKQQL